MEALLARSPIFMKNVQFGTESIQFGLKMVYLKLKIMRLEDI